MSLRLVIVKDRERDPWSSGMMREVYHIDAAAFAVWLREVLREFFRRKRR